MSAIKGVPLDIEEHIKPLSTSDKEQLIRDVQRMLDTQGPPVIEGHKLQGDWDFHDAADVAANLQAYKATLLEAPAIHIAASRVYPQASGL